MMICMHLVAKGDEVQGDQKIKKARRFLECSAQAKALTHTGTQASHARASASTRTRDRNKFVFSSFSIPSLPFNFLKLKYSPLPGW